MASAAPPADAKPDPATGAINVYLDRDGLKRFDGQHPELLQWVLTQVRVPALDPSGKTSAQWLQERTRRLTATAVVKVLGHNHYGDTAKTVYDELVHGVKKEVAPGSFLERILQHGRDLESPAVRFFEKLTGVGVEQDIGLMVGVEGVPGSDFLAATPDGITRGDPLVVEVKCPFKAPIDPSQPRFDYWVQMQIQMAVCGAVAGRCVGGHLLMYRPVAVATGSGRAVHPPVFAQLFVPFQPRWFDIAYPALQEFWRTVETELLKPKEAARAPWPGPGPLLAHYLERFRGFK